MYYYHIRKAGLIGFIVTVVCLSALLIVIAAFPVVDFISLFLALTYAAAIVSFVVSFNIFERKSR